VPEELGKRIRDMPHVNWGEEVQEILERLSHRRDMETHQRLAC